MWFLKKNNSPFYTKYSKKKKLFACNVSEIKFHKNNSFYRIGCWLVSFFGLLCLYEWKESLNSGIMTRYHKEGTGTISHLHCNALPFHCGQCSCTDFFKLGKWLKHTASSICTHFPKQNCVLISTSSQDISSHFSKLNTGHFWKGCIHIFK